MLLLAACVEAAPASLDTADEPLGSEASVTTSLRQDFEDTEPGRVPSGWNVAGYGRRTLAVTEELAARGTRALRIDIEPGQGAVVAMLLHGNLGELGEAHYGRLFMRIEGPGASEFVHFDAFEGVGPWEGQSNAVRWAATGTGAGVTRNNWSWIYNVQPSARGEFGSEGDRSAHPRVDDWMCLEWRLDAGNQEARFFLDSAEVEYLAASGGAGERTEIPAFRSFAVGFQKFQMTSGFVVWIDEVAFELDRIGCD